MTTKATKNLIKFPEPDYISSEQVTTSGNLVTVAHGLGVIPRFVIVVLRCKTAEGGYAVGEEIFQTIATPVVTSTAQRGTIVSCDTSNVYLNTGASGIGILSKSSPGTAMNITPANWRFEVRAWL